MQVSNKVKEEEKAPKKSILQLLSAVMTDVVAIDTNNNAYAAVSNLFSALQLISCFPASMHSAHSVCFWPVFSIETHCIPPLPSWRRPPPD